jgi:hypothetical protein
LRKSVEELTDADIEGASSSCDGIAFALSYILHQEFMMDLTPLSTLMRRIRAYTRKLPTWLLLQDANFADRPDEHTEIWPEQRVNELANLALPLGYTIASSKQIFTSPRGRITCDGSLVALPSGETKNVCHFFQRIARAG